MKSNVRDKLLRYGFPAVVVLLSGLLIGGAAGLITHVWLRPAEEETLPEDRPADGVYRVPAAVRYLSAAEAVEEITSLPPYELYIEGEGPAPAWYMPDEPMAAEWTDVTDIFVGDKDVPINAEAHPPVGIDAGGIDWNLCTSLVGWDGRRAEIWEMDLYAKIMYLEFWGTSPECCEAGADSILRLWESGYFGDTLGGVLTARAENGALVYSTYAYVWDVEYDPAGLCEMRELCESRFYGGPTWIAPFFQLYGYPDWAVPCYEIDGVFFSTGVQ